jgi:hypothetical protein
MIWYRALGQTVHDFLVGDVVIVQSVPVPEEQLS